MTRLRATKAFAFALSLVGCGNILGITDVPPGADGGANTTDGESSSISGSSGGSSSGADANSSICSGVSSQACGNCGTQTRTCDAGLWSDWSTCGGEGMCAPNAMQACGAGGTQTCAASCQWGDCTGQICAGAASQACGNCGTETRTCDGDAGLWSNWSTCGGEGVCAPNATQGCGTGGTQTCTASCQWGNCTGQTCAGASSQPCGNCGTETRTCNNGTWGAWGACTGEGACGPGAQQTCNTTGTMTCSAACQWGTCACPSGRVTTSSGQIYDPNTGLTWLAINTYCGAQGSITYAQAVTCCASLGMRLPTEPEAAAIDNDLCAWPYLWFTWTTTTAGTNLVYDVTNSTSYPDGLISTECTASCAAGSAQYSNALCVQ